MGDSFSEDLTRSVVTVQFSQTGCSPTCNATCPPFANIMARIASAPDGSLLVYASRAAVTSCASAQGVPQLLLYDSISCSDGSRLLNPSTFASNARFLARNFTNITWDQPYPLGVSMLKGI